MNKIIYKGIVWKIYQGALIPDIMPHIEIKLSKKDQEYLLKKSHAYFLRYTTDWNMNKETEFWYIIKDIKENMMDYNSNNRRKIRKGLKNVIVNKVSNNIIANDGYNVYKKAFLNYNTNMTLISKNDFKQSILNCKEEDFWGVYENIENGKLIAYSQNIIKNDSANYATIKFDPEYLRLYPSYALFFEMNKYYLNEQNLLYVNDGARSISHDTNIQEYLQDKFKFRKAYCKLNVIYRWDIDIIVKILYPFKNIIFKINNKIFNKLSVLLKQEKIRRSYE